MNSPKHLLYFFMTTIMLSATPAMGSDNGADDVSTINGQLVQVGDHNKYRYKYPRWNIATNPFSMIMGTYSLSASYAVHPNIAVRADVSYSDGFDGSAQGLESGISAPIFFRKVYDDWFIEPGLMFQRQEYTLVEYDDAGNRLESSSKEQAFGPLVSLGHQWMWDSGLNIAWGLGVGRNWAASRDKDEHDNRLFNAGYLRFGYAF